MVAEATKKSCKRREGDKNNTMAVDRISDLPDPLIHHSFPPFMLFEPAFFRSTGDTFLFSISKT